MSKFSKKEIVICFSQKIAPVREQIARKLDLDIDGTSNESLYEFLGKVKDLDLWVKLSEIMKMERYNQPRAKEEKLLENKNFSGPTPEGMQLYREVREALLPIVKKWFNEGFSLMDISYIVTTEVTSIILEVKAFRRRMLTKKERNKK